MQQNQQPTVFYVVGDASFDGAPDSVSNMTLSLDHTPLLEEDM
jgi:hypothetical protein